MKTNTAALALALTASAAAAPQLIPTFSLPSFSLPTIGTGLGSLGSLPTSLGSLGSGLGSASGALPTTSTTAATSDATATTGAKSTGTTTGGTASGYDGGNTANDVANNTGCRQLTYIFARGTSELGNMGTIAGPPSAEALFDSLSSNAVSVQGVDYPASIAGNANLGADGGPTMADLVSKSLSQCPDSKIALGGYSQGAMVVHNAVADQGVDASSITAVVLFGDPFNGQSVGSIDSSKVKEFCASGDSVCASGPSGTGSGTGHLSYGGDAKAAAAFITGLL